MWEFRYKNDYLNCVYDLMADAAVQSMRLLPSTARASAATTTVYW